MELPGSLVTRTLHRGKTGIVHSSASDLCKSVIPKTSPKIRSAWEAGREDNFLKRY